VAKTHIRSPTTKFCYFRTVDVSNPLKKTIGIIGGGQLGRMMIEESLRLNIAFNVLDAPDCPCATLAQKHLHGKLTDASQIKELAAISDVLTYEIEHVNVQALLELEQQGKEIIPSPKVLQVIQDKGLQKEFFIKHQIPTAPYLLVNNPEEWQQAIQQLGGEKMVAKTRTEGYDGKGVNIFTTAQVLASAQHVPFNEPCVLEQFIPCQKELSVMVAVDKKGNILTWPVVEMVFDAGANLVTFLDCPATINDATAQKARAIAHQTIKAFNSAGVFAVEMFLTQSGDVLVNEVAPRPHNSGHHTIEACYTSQFEQLVRILAGLPLGSTELIQPAVMMNLLGSPGVNGPYLLQGLKEVSAMQGVYVHLYGKKESKPMRKMGHVTIIAPTLAQARQTAQQVHQTLRFVAS
jgi:5-(carboxyamino)imidazole ribonucleotide synthase